MTVTIRFLVPGEWRVYRDVRLAALQDAPEAFGGSYEESAAYPDQQWIAWCGQPSWFAFDDLDPVGMVRVFRPEGDGLPELMSMWVAPEFRGGTIAADLVRHVIDWAESEGYAGVVLAAMKENGRATRLYERLGFVLNGIRHELPDGRLEIELEYRFVSARSSSA